MAGLAPGPELIPQWLHKHSLKWSKEQITLYREIYGNGIISTSIKIYFGSLLALCRLFILTPLQKGKRSIAQGAYINFRGGAVFAVVFVASSQAAAVCGETDQLKCRTPIVNNYFSMTVLKLGLSFSCISLSPESLIKKHTHILTHCGTFKIYRPCSQVVMWLSIKWSGDVAMRWWGNVTHTEELVIFPFLCFLFFMEEKLTIRGFIQPNQQTNVFIPLGVSSIIFKQLWLFKVLLFLTSEL